MNVTAIVPAAGTGQRMGHRLKKPYIALQGVPILVHTLCVLDREPSISRIVIPVYPGEEERCEQEVLGMFKARAAISIIAGGARRQDSVRHALALVPGDSDVVLVHDGARPLVSPGLIEKAVLRALTNSAVTLAVPVKDTITMVCRDNMTISRTPPRDELYVIQTPQAFLREVICEAHRKALADGFQGTDDASLVERLGVPVSVIPGSYENIKITTAEDLVVAEAIMKGRAQ